MGSQYSKYFAAETPENLAKKIMEKVEDYDKYVASSGRQSLWSRVYTYYNRGAYKDARLARLGDQGEYTEIYINHLRNLLQHILTMTTKERASYDARSTNTDHKSLSQTIVAKGILDYYNREQGIDNIGKKAVEDVLQFADAYVYQGWDFSLGDDVQADTNRPGKVIKQGDVFHKNFTPLDVIFDINSGLHNAKRNWVILRDFQNKWDLVERFPELRDQILSYSNNSKIWDHMRIGSPFKDDSDYVPVMLFFHNRTDSMPQGRLFSCLGSDCWLVDTQLPMFYKEFPVYRLCASEQNGSGFGYSIAYDLCPIQEAIDGLYSTVLTNQSTFGVQNILMPKGSDIDVEELADGLNLVTYDPKLGKPEVLNLLSTPPEVFKFIEMLEGVDEVLSGVNSVARGNPEASLKSGAALALVQSMAIEFISGLQKSYVQLLENLGTGLINILKANANTKRMVDISGKNNKSYIKEFDKNDIDSIQRVTVDIGNPLARTTAGKVEMANTLLGANMIETPAQYLQVLTTGNLDPLLEGKQAELMQIREENEAMSDGKQVVAILIDNHPLHIMEHKSVLSSPEARQNPEIVQTVLAHIQEHINQWKNGDPTLLAMLGQPTPPPQAPPAPPAPEGGGQAGPPPAQAAAQVLKPGNPTEKAAEKTRMPSLPKNPMSGQPPQI